MRAINVLHIASFNGNIGDNANHNGFRRRLKEITNLELKYCEIEIREFYQSWNLKSFNDEEFINLCNKSDLIVIGGGNFFELKWDYSSTGTTIDISNRTLSKIKTPILFNAIGCDIAKGFNDSTVKKFQKFLDLITEDEKYLISLRNDGSLDTIKELYGSRYENKLYKVPDGGFFIKTKSLVFREIRNGFKYIGINVAFDMQEIRFNKQIQGGLSYDEFIENFSGILNGFLDNNREYQIIFFPHVYSDLAATSKILEKIVDKFRRTKVVVAPYLTGKGSEEYIFGLYKECECILGMRFHSNVCSIAQGIPSIGLASYKKIQDLYAELGLLDRVVCINESGFEEKLEKEMNYTIDHIEEIKSRYKKVCLDLEESNKKFNIKIKRWIKNSNIIPK